jgi:hypothetical protein
MNERRIPIPFDIYDFFGYLFPGFLMCLYFWIFCKFTNIEFIKNLDSYKIYMSDTFTLLLSIVALIIIFYIMGHLVATLGVLALDRIFFYGIFDLPVNYLLNIEHETRTYVEATYKYIFFISHLVFILTIFTYIRSLRYIIYILILFLIFLILFRFFTEIIRFFYKETKVFINIADNGFVRSVILRPTRIIDPILNLIRMAVNNNKKFPDEFIHNYEKAFMNTFNMDYRKAKDENYWLPFFYVASKDQYHTNLIRNWHNLYGFSRNISCASYISVLITAGWLIYHGETYNVYVAYQLIISLIVAWIFYLRYLNLNQTYHTKNIIRSFLTLYLRESKYEQNNNSQEKVCFKNQ